MTLGSKKTSSQVSLQGEPVENSEVPVPGGGEVSPAPSPLSGRMATWAVISPFFLSAVFYLSALFSVVAPLPILILGVRKGARWAWMAAITNGAIVAILGGSLKFYCFFVFVIVLSLTLADMISRKKSVEKAVAVTLAAMGIAGALLLAGIVSVEHINPIQSLKAQISEFIDYLSQSPAAGSMRLSEGESEEWKQTLLLEFPSAVAIFAFVLVLANLLLVLKTNVYGVRERLGLDATVFRTWKAPGWLVWPTLFFGAFLVADFGRVSDVAVNGFRFLMAIYAVQGMSILSFLMDSWKVRGGIRWVGFALSILFMMPLVLSLGFFDLWFDFRSKFRQS